MKRHSKAYTEQIRNKAIELTILDDSGEVIDFRSTAMRLMKSTGCTYMTARKHVARAAKRKINPDYEHPQWGGKREGGGRPFDYIIDVVDGRYIVSQRVSGKTGLLEYSSAVNWRDLEKAAETAVAAQEGGINANARRQCPEWLVEKAVWDED